LNVIVVGVDLLLARRDTQPSQYASLAAKSHDLYYRTRDHGTFGKLAKERQRKAKAFVRSVKGLTHSTDNGGPESRIGDPIVGPQNAGLENRDQIH